MSQTFKNLREMGYVKIMVSTIDQNIIRKCNHRFAQQRAKNVIHSGSKCCRSITEVKRHHMILVMSTMSVKSCLGLS